MSGGLIQLVAYGMQDLFLTRDPQITFFKIVYRRHTNFSIEPVKQTFNYPPNFGKRSSCTLSRYGDLIGQTYLVIVLPSIQQTVETDYTNMSTAQKFAWVKKIGFAILKNIKIEIGGHIIDEQYGEWLNLWYELFGPREEGFDEMIGNVPELVNFSYNKESFELYIPLQFWFCKSPGSALPMVSLQYTDVRITIELNEFDKCHVASPTNFIEVNNDVVNFKQGEIIEQVVDGRVATGIFTNFDFVTKRLYYIRTSVDQFRSLQSNVTGIIDQSNQMFNVRNNKYFIRGTETGYIVMPKFYSTPQLNPVTLPVNYNLDDCFLLVDYIYLDDEERIRFMKSKTDYLIEQVIFVNEKTIESPSRTVKLDLVQPCKLLVWVTQLSFLLDINDFFNYSNLPNIGPITNRTFFRRSNVVAETILLNSLPRLSFREYQYFNYVQPYQHCTYSPSEGINVYSFCLFPNQLQPSGSCNMSQIDNIEIQLLMNQVISITNTLKFRAYGLVNNILRVANGLAGVVFTR